MNMFIILLAAVKIIEIQQICYVSDNTHLVHPLCTSIQFANKRTKPELIERLAGNAEKLFDFELVWSHNIGLFRVKAGDAENKIIWFWIDFTPHNIGWSKSKYYQDKLRMRPRSDELM